jgi:hypothetical protein
MIAKYLGEFLLKLSIWVSSWKLNCTTTLVVAVAHNIAFIVSLMTPWYARGCYDEYESLIANIVDSSVRIPWSWQWSRKTGLAGASAMLNIWVSPDRAHNIALIGQWSRKTGLAGVSIPLVIDCSLRPKRFLVSPDSAHNIRWWSVLSRHGMLVQPWWPWCCSLLNIWVSFVIWPRPDRSILTKSTVIRQYWLDC